MNYQIGRLYIDWTVNKCILSDLMTLRNEINQSVLKSL